MRETGMREDKRQVFNKLMMMMMMMMTDEMTCL